MRTIRTAVLPALVLAPALALAQEARPKYVVLHQELAKPSMVQQYEATSKEFVALVKKNKALMPHFGFECIQGSDFTYTYLAPIKSMADVDAINAEFGALAQAAGPAFADVSKRGGDATEYFRESVLALAPEMSYVPTQPRLKPEEMPYRHVDLYFVRPGAEPEADAVSADFVKLFKAKNVSNGYNLYKAAFGPELPLYLIAVGARDAADYHAEDARLRTLLGAEGQALFARAFALTRRFESHDGTLRPDLSVPVR